MLRNPGFYRTKVGSLPLVALYEGYTTRDRAPGFVKNADPEAVEKAFLEAGIASGKLTITFSSLLIEAPDGLILVDTGFGNNGLPTNGRLLDNLASAGHAAADVRTVIISHCHRDHIYGLITPGNTLTFPNAQVLVSGPDLRFWLDDKTRQDYPAYRDNIDLCEKVFGLLGNRVTTYEWNEQVHPSIKALRADGHTPGQSILDITSDGERLRFLADITNNPLIFARMPRWQAKFDMDGDLAVETRLRVLGEAADENMRVFFYHAPFPAIGRVARNDGGFLFMPEIWP